MLKELTTQDIINRLIGNEVARVNDIKPLYASTHEGWALMKEEIEEANDELDIVNALHNKFWNQIKYDHNNNEIIQDVIDIKLRSIKAIEELIQVCCVCDRFEQSSKEWD